MFFRLTKIFSLQALVKQYINHYRITQFKDTGYFTLGTFSYVLVYFITTHLIVRLFMYFTLRASEINSMPFGLNILWVLFLMLCMVGCLLLNMRLFVGNSAYEEYKWNKSIAMYLIKRSSRKKYSEEISDLIAILYTTGIENKYNLEFIFFGKRLANLLIENENNSDKEYFKLVTMLLGSDYNPTVKSLKGLLNDDRGLLAVENLYFEDGYKVDDIYSEQLNTIYKKLNSLYLVRS